MLALGSCSVSPNAFNVAPDRTLQSAGSGTSRPTGPSPVLSAITRRSTAGCSASAHRASEGASSTRERLGRQLVSRQLRPSRDDRSRGITCVSLDRRRWEERKKPASAVSFSTRPRAVVPNAGVSSTMSWWKSFIAAGTSR